MYYNEQTYLTSAIGNNTLTFSERKNKWSDCCLRIPPLREWILESVDYDKHNTCYEYIDEDWKFISSYGLESLVKIDFHGKDITIIDNHNHAFAMRWRSFLDNKIKQWSHLVHIDQHSDFAEPEEWLNIVENGWMLLKHNEKMIENSERTAYLRHSALMCEVTELVEESFIDYWRSCQTDKKFLHSTAFQSKWQKMKILQKIDTYTNEVLTIADFIKPALQCGLCGSHEMILTEYGLLNYDSWRLSLSTILDIDLDFRAPEMSIQAYEKTINQVRKFMFLPQIWCITIATSPTYIDQERALEVLRDLLA